MKQKRVFAIFALVALAVSSHAAFAVEQPALTDDQIEHIRNTCGDTQTAISSIRAADKVAYVNINQQLDTLSNRLMAPMNSRVALNKLDGVAMIKTTVDFTTETKKFQTLYRDYVDSVDAAATMGCYNQPVEFYDNLTSLLQKRTAVRASYDRLNGLIQQYRSEVQTLEKQALSEGQS